MRLDELVEDFAHSQLRRDLSPMTVRAYAWALKDLQQGMRQAGLHDTADLTREVLEDWQDTLLEREMAPRSRSLAVTAARQLIRWAVERGVADPALEKALAKVKVPEGRPHPIPKADLERIKAYLLGNHGGGSPTRDCALFFCLLSTGARVSEALQMRRDALDGPTVRQKGGSHKRLLMPPEVVRLIEIYLGERTDQLPELWVTWDRDASVRAMNAGDVRATWKSLTRLIGIPYFTTHAIRHTCATELLEAGIPELVIAEHLGHHGLGTLANYGQVRDKQRQGAVDVMQRLVTT